MSIQGWALLVAAVAVGTLYMLPLCFAPLFFASIAGWRIADHDELAVYFGRCLGALIAVLVGLALYAVFVPMYQPVAMATTTGACALMVIVHGVGALENKQPRFETFEGGVWLIATLVFGWIGSAT